MMSLFYSVMRFAYANVFGSQQMLHYPLHGEGDKTLLDGQVRFTEACLSRLGALEGRALLDVGCGNGVQALYIQRTHTPSRLHGVDLNAMHIGLAQEAAAQAAAPGLSFAVDDAQKLASVPDESVDAVLCTESAHHYPDKDAFLAQVKRVLRPGGRFVIADLLLRDGVKPRRIDPSLSLFYWSLPRYRDALSVNGLVLDAEEELTDRLIAGFEDRSGWFDGASGSGYLPSAVGKAIGRGLTSVYLYELRNRFHYFLLAGAKA